MAKIRREKPLLEFSEEELEEKDSTISNLLSPDKTIRDAVHGDIMVTKLEKSLMDTKEFQRLHKIRQLGLSYLVWPCSNHTRFDHSLGTLYMTQYLIEQLLKNPYKDRRVPIHVTSPYFNVCYPTSATLSTAVFTNFHILLARICALLHDLAHIPFGHTLEDEGFLFPGQWKDKERVSHFLGDESTIGKIIVDTIDKHHLDGKNFLQNIQEILVAKRSEVGNLTYPFVADIISNTVCADLLDYVKRDIYFCGLHEDYDERFIKYFYLGIYKEKPRMILRLIKPRTGRIRRDILSEALHLLRLRYSLAEKVYYHHTKINASAMIISAANAAIQNRDISKNELFEIGDDEFLILLKKNEIGKFLIENIERRLLYKPIYKLSYSESIIGDHTSKRKREIIEEFTNPKRRYERERDLEKMNRLGRGQVIIYCPGPEMGQKVVETLVDWGIKTEPLNEIEHERIKDEIYSSIIKKHQELWNMYVLIDPSIDKDIKANLASDCITDIFRITNEIEDEEYCQFSRNYLDRFRIFTERELKQTIHSDLHEDICARYRRDESYYKIISYEDYLSYLREIAK